MPVYEREVEVDVLPILNITSLCRFQTQHYENLIVLNTLQVLQVHGITLLSVISDLFTFDCFSVTISIYLYQ